MPTPPEGQILVDREIRAEIGRAIGEVSGAPPISPAQLQPASLDLRLGSLGWRIRAGFLPGEIPLERRIERLAEEEIDLRGDGSVLERGQVYLIPLEEELDLPAELRARFNPRSSTGRCDLFTRILCSSHPRFDETPPGYRGRLWMEVSPLSFPVRLRRGDRLGQLRLQRGNPLVGAEELRAIHAATPLCFDGDHPLSPEEVRIDADGDLLLRVGLVGRNPAGWRAKGDTGVLNFSGEGIHATSDFWEPVRAGDGRCILIPGSFYIFASRERLAIPPTLAAEMLPVDVGIGELRSNYAGFFDSGFGWGESRRGTPAVLEVRAHDVPFLVEDGQVFCRLRFFRTSGHPEELYGVGRSRSYQDQDLTLARQFGRTVPEQK
jgi:dCTP deaminase